MADPRCAPPTTDYLNVQPTSTFPPRTPRKPDLRTRTLRAFACHNFLFMAHIFPFAALRPAPEAAAAVAAVPYDVVSTEEARALAAEQSAELPSRLACRDRFAAWNRSVLRPGVRACRRRTFAICGSRAPLVVEDPPSFYVYQLQMGDHVQSGIAACFSIDEYEQGLIKKHEKTRPDKEDDRTRHMLAIGAPNRAGVPDVCRLRPIDRDCRAHGAGKPLFDFAAPDECGTPSGGWQTSTARSSTRSRGFRSSTSPMDIIVRRVRRARGARWREEARANTIVCSPSPFPTTRCRSFPTTVWSRTSTAERRAVSWQRSGRGSRFVTTDRRRRQRKGDVGLYLKGRWYTIELAAGGGHRCAAALDVSRLQDAVLAPIRVRTCVRTSALILSGGSAAPAELQRLVDSGQFAAAFSLYPGNDRRPDAHCGCRRHHAAQVDLVRAEAARRPAVAPDMKVLIADKFERSGIEGLKACGCEVIYQPDLKDDALAGRSARPGAQVLVVRSTQVTEPMLDAGELSLIVRAGAGVNTIDVAAASRRGIYVSNCPARTRSPSPSSMFALLLAIDRRVPENVRSSVRASGTRKSSRRRSGLYRPNARTPRVRQHRAGSRPPSPRLRHAGDGLEPTVFAGRGRAGRHSGDFGVSVVGRSATGCRRCGYRQRPPRAHQGDPGFVGAELLSDAARRHRDQHRARRSHGLHGARRSRARKGRARRPRRVCRRAIGRDRRNHRSDRRVARRLRNAPHWCLN